EAVVACDAMYPKNDPKAFAASIELCAPWVLSATFNKDASTKARSVKTGFGSNYRPKKGINLAMLSTGAALDSSDPGFISPEPGSAFANDDTNPLPMSNNNAC